MGLQTRSKPAPRITAIDQATFATILAATDIGRLVGESVVLKKVGANLVGLCPFHVEKSPSFTVSVAKGFFKCFGCGVRGSAIDFLMRRDGLNFVEATRSLAASVGVHVPTAKDGAEPAARSPAKPTAGPTPTLSLVKAAPPIAGAEQMRDALAKAQRVYSSNLAMNEPALEYLRDERRITEQTAERFGLGYAPPGWRTLEAEFSDYALSPVLLAAGLTRPAAKGTHRFDCFRDRMMFPVHDLCGQVIAFAGRVLGSASTGPKYLNSPASTFDKSATVYGLFQAQEAIRESEIAIVVEGPFDVLSLSQAGFLNVVCPLGTALTSTHVEQLAAMARRVVLSFDGDTAGREATKRALALTSPLVDAQRLDVRVLTLPDGLDPDLCVRKDGPTFYGQMLDAALRQVGSRHSRRTAP